MKVARVSVAVAAVAVLAAGAALAEAEGGLRVTVDAGRVSGTLEPFWASQIIHPTESLEAEQGQALLRLMAETGAARQYVRIYNQPEYAARVADDGTVTYDWSRFDKMAQMILATGNRLKVVFFGMPTALAAYPKSILKRPTGVTVCISPPKDYGQWEALCADFTRHVIARYGRDEVTRWTFRCWNEPDLAGFWHKADLPEYLKLYDHFAKGVKGVCPEIKIGGPALTSTGTYKKPQNFTFFLDHVTSGTNHATGGTGSPVDFLAVHTYGGSGGGGGPGREFPDVAYLIEQQTRLADLRDQYPGLRNVPIHVEEWGETSGGTKGVDTQPKADVRNSEYGAAFLACWVERHIRLRQERDRRIDAFTFCASGYEKPPARDFMGYRTLHTKNGFHKPLLNAYTLLGKTCGELVHVSGVPADGPVGVFATREGGRVAVVLVNYQHDRLDSREGVTFPVEVKVALPWAPETPVMLTHWRIDREHSNAYTVFRALGSPAEPTPEEAGKIRARMGLEALEAGRAMRAAELGEGLRFALPCNAVSLLEIVRRDP